MFLKKVLNFRGLNYWVLGAGLGANLLWTFLLLGIIYWFVTGASPQSSALVQLGLLIGLFLGPLLIGLMLGRMAADGRGPSYGLISTTGSLVVALFVLAPIGILGIMALFVIPAGGLNGGLLAERRSVRR